MFAFVDESCFLTPPTYKNGDNSPYATLVAVCIHERYLRELDKTVFAIKRSFFGVDANVEIKAENFINKRILDPKFDKNKRCIEEIFNVITKKINMRFLGIICERPEKKLSERDDKLPYHYTQLMYKINDYGEQLSQDMFVVFDNQDHGIDSELSRKYGNLIHKSNRPIDYLQASPFFVSSSMVPGIQIADIVAGLLRHNRCLEGSSALYPAAFGDWIKEKYRLIKPMFPSVANMPGIYEIRNPKNLT